MSDNFDPNVDVLDDEPGLAPVSSEGYSDCETGLGINGYQIAVVCRNGFLKNLCREPNRSPEAEKRWCEAVEWVFDKCERQVENLSFRTMANHFQRIATGEEVDEQPILLACAWDAAVRTAVNCIMALDQAEYEEAAAHDWREWIMSRSRKGVVNYDDSNRDGEDDGEDE